MERRLDVSLSSLLEPLQQFEKALRDRLLDHPRIELAQLRADLILNSAVHLGATLSRSELPTPTIPFQDETVILQSL
jgi:hypothetical protein